MTQLAKKQLAMRTWDSDVKYRYAQGYILSALKGNEDVPAYITDIIHGKSPDYWLSSDSYDAELFIFTAMQPTPSVLFYVPELGGIVTRYPRFLEESDKVREPQPDEDKPETYGLVSYPFY